MAHPSHQDLVGFHPAFRRQAASGAADAPRGDRSARTLAELVAGGHAAREAIDPLGLATMLHLGFPLGVRTPVVGIERFPTGRVLGVDGQARDVRTLQPRGRAPTTAELTEIVLDACRRHAPSDDPVVMLSGGRDSRLLLLGLRAIGRAPRALLTVGRPGFVPDATTAAAVCEALGLRVEACDGMVYSGRREMDRHRAQSFESLEHEWLGVLLRQARRVAGPDPCITDGLGAGVLSTGSLMHEEAIALWRSGALDALAEWVLEAAVGVGPRFLEAVRREGFPLASRDEVLQELTRVLRSLSVWPNPLGAFSLLHWSRRGISASPYGLLSRQDRVFAPLCDDALVEALLALDIDQAFAVDWREPVVAQLWGRGPMPAYAEGTPRRPLRAKILLRASSVAWWLFARGLPEPLRRIAASVDVDSSRTKRALNRSAVAYLAALGELLGGPAAPAPVLQAAGRRDDDGRSSEASNG